MCDHYAFDFRIVAKNRIDSVGECDPMSDRDVWYY